MTRRFARTAVAAAIAAALALLFAHVTVYQREHDDADRQYADGDGNDGSDRG